MHVPCSKPSGIDIPIPCLVVIHARLHWPGQRVRPLHGQLCGGKSIGVSYFVSPSRKLVASKDSPRPYNDTKLSIQPIWDWPHKSVQNHNRPPHFCTDV